MNSTNLVVIVRLCGNVVAKAHGKPARVVGRGECRLDQSAALALLPQLGEPTLNATNDGLVTIDFPLCPWQTGKKSALGGFDGSSLLRHDLCRAPDVHRQGQNQGLAPLPRFVGGWAEYVGAEVVAGDAEFSLNRPGEPWRNWPLVGYPLIDKCRRGSDPPPKLSLAADLRAEGFNRVHARTIASLPMTVNSFANRMCERCSIASLYA